MDGLLPVLAVYPDGRLGKFRIGDALYDVLRKVVEDERLVQGQQQVIYSSTHPVQSPIYVTLLHGSLRLQFAGETQELELIEVLDFTRLKLTYNGTQLSHHHDTPPSFNNLYKLFGPTYPGVHIPELSIYIVSYPNIAFSFDLPSPKTEADQSVSHVEAIKQLSSASSRGARAMALFHEPKWTAVASAVVPKTDNSTPKTITTTSRRAIVTPQVGIEIDGKTITLGESPSQEIITNFGAPDAIFRRSDDRLMIHNTTTENNDDIQDYFYNYFRHGFDVLLDGHSHHVIKIVLHANVPCAYDFDRWKRIQWQIQLQSILYHSETPFKDIRARIPDISTPILLNRSCDSPTSSFELLNSDADGTNTEPQFGVTRKLVIYTHTLTVQGCMSTRAWRLKCWLDPTS